VIFDFTEKKEGDTNVNFTTLAPEEFSIKSIELVSETGVAPFHLPFPKKYGGELEDNDLNSQEHKGMAEFSIFTS
jgi:hypothetical protein